MDLTLRKILSLLVVLMMSFSLAVACANDDDDDNDDNDTMNDDDDDSTTGCDQWASMAQCEGDSCLWVIPTPATDPNDPARDTFCIETDDTCATLCGKVTTCDGNLAQDDCLFDCNYLHMSEPATFTTVETCVTDADAADCTAVIGCLPGK